jgi:outer membrane protein assembly factor BamE (lipoprotein component of BamABCDE complex)
MRRITAVYLFLLLFSVGCTDNSLKQASISYKTNHDYASLKVIYNSLSTGMSRTEVDNLLGEPDHSPIDGQYYYLSDRKEPPEPGMDNIKVPVGMVISYRDKSGQITDKIQEISFGPIGE